MLGLVYTKGAQTFGPMVEVAQGWSMGWIYHCIGLSVWPLHLDLVPEWPCVWNLLSGIPTNWMTQPCRLEIEHHWFIPLCLHVWICTVCKTIYVETPSIVNYGIDLGQYLKKQTNYEHTVLKFSSIHPSLHPYFNSSQALVLFLNTFK